jgi:hypothetical protein
MSNIATPIPPKRERFQLHTANVRRRAEICNSWIGYGTLASLDTPSSYITLLILPEAKVSNDDHSMTVSTVTKANTAMEMRTTKGVGVGMRI